MTTATAYAKEFEGSPRHQKILAVFQAVDDLEEEESVTKVLALMSRTTIGLNSIERDRLPNLVRQALKERGRSGPF